MLKLAEIKDYKKFNQLVLNNIDRIKDYFPTSVNKASTLEGAKDYISVMRDEINNNTCNLYLYFIVKENEIIGAVFIKNLDYKVMKCELAYFIDEKHTRKGHSKSALKNLMKIAFNEFKMNKVFIRVDPSNIASQKTAESLDFKLEGKLRNEYKISSGKLVDLYYYGLIKSGFDFKS